LLVRVLGSIRLACLLVRKACLVPGYRDRTRLAQSGEQLACFRVRFEGILIAALP